MLTLSFRDEHHNSHPPGAICLHSLLHPPADRQQKTVWHDVNITRKWKGHPLRLAEGIGVESLHDRSLFSNVGIVHINQVVTFAPNLFSDAQVNRVDQRRAQVCFLN